MQLSVSREKAARAKLLASLSSDFKPLEGNPNFTNPNSPEWVAGQRYRSLSGITSTANALREACDPRLDSTPNNQNQQIGKFADPDALKVYVLVQPEGDDFAAAQQPPRYEPVAGAIFYKQEGRLHGLFGLGGRTSSETMLAGVVTQSNKKVYFRHLGVLGAIAEDQLIIVAPKPTVTTEEQPVT